MYVGCVCFAIAFIFSFFYQQNDNILIDRRLTATGQTGPLEEQTYSYASKPIIIFIFFIIKKININIKHIKDALTLTPTVLY